MTMQLFRGQIFTFRACSAPSNPHRGHSGMTKLSTNQLLQRELTCGHGVDLSCKTSQATLALRDLSIWEASSPPHPAGALDRAKRA